MKEIILRNGPYTEYEELEPFDIIEKVKNPKCDSCFRPLVRTASKMGHENEEGLLSLVKACWSETPNMRPSTHNALKQLKNMTRGHSENLVDNMVKMLEKYANNLEEIVAERTKQLEEEKRKTDLLLYRMLPQPVAEDLKQGRSVEAEWFDDVTIYFSDIVRFTDLASESTPMQIVHLLNSLYTLFDDIITGHDVYKVETIGDAYMIVSGLPNKNGRRHAQEIANCALELRDAVATKFKVPHRPEHKMQIRIGLHTGPCAAGVVGLAMPRYCLFGDTVNTASRMESNGEGMKIHMSSATYMALTGAGDQYRILPRGEISIKGKGEMSTYWLIGHKPNKE